MHAFPRTGPSAMRNNVPTGVFFAVAGGFKRPDQFNLKAVFGQASLQILANLTVVFARRVQRWNTDEILRQRDQVVLFAVNARKKVSFKGG